MKKPISGRLVTASILDVIKNLPLPQVIQIRDLCNETIQCEIARAPKEVADEFRTWRIKDSSKV